MADLHLNVKKIYFDQIKSGEKTEEYRLFNDFWKKRLIGRSYTRVLIKCGYPKKDNTSRILVFPYNGYVIKNLKHHHFGDDPVKVFAIQLGKEPTF